MARKFTFNTFRLVALRDDDVKDEDVFMIDFIVDGESTLSLPRDKKVEAADFLLEFYENLNKQAMQRHEENQAVKEAGRV